MASEQAQKASIHAKLQESGEYDRSSPRAASGDVPAHRPPPAAQIEGAAAPAANRQRVARPAQRVHHWCAASHSRPPDWPINFRPLAELIRNKGDAHLTVEQLTQEITPQGRGAHVPSCVCASAR